jgi:PPOX class probable F420-dependent enzyme
MVRRAGIHDDRRTEMAELTDSQAELFLQPNYGTATTLRADGSPHTTVVWVDWDGENVVFNTNEQRAKAEHLHRDPRANVTVIDRDDPYRWISVTGSAELAHEGAAEHISKLSQKYRGDPEYPLKPGEQRVLVRVRPERVTAYGVE